MFQISVMCDAAGLSRASCGECPKPPDAIDNTWCTGGNQCEIQAFKALNGVDRRPTLSIDTCVSKYIFERSLVLRKVLNYVPL